MWRLYRYLFPALWIAFIAYWQIKARHTKTTERLEHAATRIVRALVLFIAIALLILPHLPAAWLYYPVLPYREWCFFLGGAVTCTGLMFAVWAREFLGANWSRSVTLKRDHQLIVAGPYRLVRHPIYTGIISGFLGTAIALGQLRGFIAFMLVSLVLWAKLRVEEQWMRDRFGSSYEAYSQRVAAIVPFLL